MTAASGSAVFCVAFATFADAPGVDVDDALAVDVLHERGDVQVTACSWKDPSVRWGGFDAVVIRSTWDYIHAPAAFLVWLREVEDVHGVVVWNRAALIEWNHVKSRYLPELVDTLQAQGSAVQIPGSLWLEKAEDWGRDQTLDDLMREKGWSEVVVKPTVSCGAYQTHRVRLGDSEREPLEPHIQHELSNGRGLVVQEYMELVQQGEYSLLFFGGLFSHAVHKQPVVGEFRVHEEHGGKNSLVERVPQAMLDQATSVVAAVTARNADVAPLYVRIDALYDELRQVIVLMEVEAIEPTLYLRCGGRAAAEKFADVLTERLIAERERADKCSREERDGDEEEEIRQTTT